MSIIKIESLKKIYNCGTIALNTISMNIEEGDFFALLGKNGAGKSTTIGILISLIKKTSGKVYIHGYDLDIDYLNIKALIGFVPQEYNFNQFEKVIDIIVNQAGYYGINRTLALNRAEYFLKLFGLWEKKDSVSIKLSGGMKRRLMIIRALIHKPKILILDEPTAGVDIISRRLIWNFLKEINKVQNTTIILTTHYLEEVELLCNNVSIIDSGKILVNTRVKDLLFNLGERTFILKVDSNHINYINDIIAKKTKYKFVILDNNLLEVVIPENKNLNDLFSFFISSKITVYDIKSKYNKLEELFIDLIS